MKQILRNILVALYAIIIILLLTNACGYSQLTSQKMLKKSMSRSYDVVVVPGIPFTNKEWGLAMKFRIYWSKYLFDKGIAKNIMFSGSAVYSPFYEGKIMAMYAEAIGIPKEHILVESKAQHSTENIYYSYKKAQKLGYINIALASDPFQAKMLRRFIHKKVSRNVDIIPFVTDTLKAMLPIMTDPVIDYDQAYMNGFVSLPERESFFKRLKGTRGLNIDHTAYN
jgi:vancomycin permeability regulator SanA